MGPGISRTSGITWICWQRRQADPCSSSYFNAKVQGQATTSVLSSRTWRHHAGNPPSTLPPSPLNTYSSAGHRLGLSAFCFSANVCITPVSASPSRAASSGRSGKERVVSPMWKASARGGAWAAGARTVEG